MITLVFIINVAALNSIVTAQTKTPSKVEPTPSPETVREVDFCEIVRQPRRFFNQRVRITATYAQGFEFSYLVDDRCASSLEIAIRFAVEQDESSKTNIARLFEREYGGRAKLTLVGALRGPRNNYGYFNYIFEIARLESVAHVIDPYQGDLQPGKTYRAVVRGDKEAGLLLGPPVRTQPQYAVRIEWINLVEFPLLARLHETSGERTIVFSVLSDVIKQIEVQRWNRKFECKIIRIE